MLVYKLKLSNNTEFDFCIDLLNTPFVDRWKSYMQDLSVRLPKINWRLVPNACKVVSKKDANVTHLLKLHDAFEFLHYFNLGNYEKELDDLDFLIKNPSHLRQRYLNIWHRHFTTQATEWYAGRIVAPEGLIQETFDAIHTLNQYAHLLETSTYQHLNRSDLIKGKVISYINCTDSREFAIKDQLWSGNNSVRVLPDTFDPLENSYRHTVWLNEDIQGKDQIKSWLEEDDLTASDCTGNLFLTPNLMLDPSLLYHAVMSNPDWQKQHEACGKPVNRWPIGDIVNLEYINWNELYEATVQSVVLDEKTLWSMI